MRRPTTATLLWTFFAVLVVRNEAESQDECGPKGKPCVDLSTCSPPRDRLVVPEQVVLVMGMTGCGKSTLTKHLSRHDDDMVAELDGANMLISGSRIGSGMASVTSVPDLMTDNSTGINYYDCPGFQDNRGSCIEVSTTYYMKDILRHAKQVKVLLLTPHFSVLKGQDRSSLLTMLRNAAQVLQDVSAVKDSLALVVTKVSSYAAPEDDDGEWLPTPEDELKASAAAFLLEDMLPFLEKMARTGSQDSRDEHRRAAQIVKVLLTNKNRVYTRIGIFRTPDEVGTLRDIALIENGRASLLRLVRDNIQYASVQPANFGFAVSARTKVFAYESARALSAEVMAKLTALGAAVGARLSAEARGAADVPSREERFQLAAANLSDFAVRLKKSPGVLDFGDSVRAEMPGQPGVEAVAAACQQLDVLQVVGDKPLVDATVIGTQWVRPIQDAADSLLAQMGWQRTLAATYDRLNKYDMQARRAAQKGEAFPAVTAATADQFLQSLGLAAQVHQAAANLTELNSLLSLANQGPDVECQADSHVVRGDTVLLSEAVTAARRCLGGGALEVYATNTVFVDAATLPGRHLVVVAPRIEAVGHPTISVSGQDGAAPARPPREGSNGARGTDGQPGRPGQPGGSVLLVAAEFVGKVTVAANGGRGGDGQRGGGGAPGKPGGGNGGNGGDGGAGGLGGSPGRVRVVVLGGGSAGGLVHVSAARGAQGAGGRGGLGGDRRAFTGVVRSRRKRAIIAAIVTILAVGAVVAGGVAMAKAAKGQDQPPPPPPPTFYNGARGNDGVATVGREAPAAARAPSWTHVSARAQEYARLSLGHQYRSREMREFLRMLEEHKAF